MPAIARVGDSTNHGGVVMGPGSPTVLIAGMPAAVLGDMHICAIPPTPASPHPTSTPFIVGSATVMIGGKPVVRVGDSTACGAAVVVGAPTVTAGG
jgi:uncharacterized Zn-binding protein involved in type VI secretion